MIHFDTKEIDGDRELWRDGDLVGWIEQGRKMVNLSGKQWTEWGFVAADLGTKIIVRDNIAAAYDDARAHVEEGLQ